MSIIQTTVTTTAMPQRENATYGRSDIVGVDDIPVADDERNTLQKRSFLHIDVPKYPYQVQKSDVQNGRKHFDDRRVQMLEHVGQPTAHTEDDAQNQ